MKLSTFLGSINNLPENIQRLAQQVVVSTAMSLHNTEREMLTNNSIGGYTQTLGSHSALGSMKGGVVNEQTKQYTQTFKMIMERMDRIERGPDGRMIIDENTGRAAFLNESQYAQKRQNDSRSKTDLRDDYPIELDWQAKRVLMNETYRPGEKKEYSINVAFERNGGAMVSLEDYLVAAHVKTLPSWSTYPKLLEFYTNIQRPMPQFDALQSGGGLQAIAGNINMALLTESTHQGEEVFGYKILAFDKCVVHNGQLVYKFFVEQFIG